MDKDLNETVALALGYIEKDDLKSIEALLSKDSSPLYYTWNEEYVLLLEALKKKREAFLHLFLDIITREDEFSFDGFLINHPFILNSPGLLKKVLSPDLTGVHPFFNYFFEAIKRMIDPQKRFNENAFNPELTEKVYLFLKEREVDLLPVCPEIFQALIEWRRGTAFFPGFLRRLKELTRGLGKALKGCILLGIAKEDSEITGMLLALSDEDDSCIPPLPDGSELFYPIAAGDEDMTRILLEKGAAPDFQGVDGKTPLIHGVMRDHFSIVKLLVGHGAIADLRDHKNRTAAHYAQSKEVLDYLLSREFRGPAEDLLGLTPGQLLDLRMGKESSPEEAGRILEMNYTPAAKELSFEELKALGRKLITSENGKGVGAAVSGYWQNLQRKRCSDNLKLVDKLFQGEEESFETLLSPFSDGPRLRLRVSLFLIYLSRKKQKKSALAEKYFSTIKEASWEEFDPHQWDWALLSAFSDGDDPFLRNVGKFFFSFFEEPRVNGLTEWYNFSLTCGDAWFRDKIFARIKEVAGGWKIHYLHDLLELYYSLWSSMIRNGAPGNFPELFKVTLKALEMDTGKSIEASLEKLTYLKDFERLLSLVSLIKERNDETLKKEFLEALWPEEESFDLAYIKLCREIDKIREKDPLLKAANKKNLTGTEREKVIAEASDQTFALFEVRDFITEDLEKGAADSAYALAEKYFPMSRIDDEQKCIIESFLKHYKKHPNMFRQEDFTKIFSFLKKMFSNGSDPDARDGFIELFTVSAAAGFYGECFRLIDFVEDTEKYSAVKSITGKGHSLQKMLLYLHTDNNVLDRIHCFLALRQDFLAFEQWLPALVSFIFDPPGREVIGDYNRHNHLFDYEGFLGLSDRDALAESLSREDYSVLFEGIDSEVQEKIKAIFQYALAGSISESERVIEKLEEEEGHEGIGVFFRFLQNLLLSKTGFDETHHELLAHNFAGTAPSISLTLENIDLFSRE